ncbi:hypothetical protein QW131_15245 [Roseibium salinum]|nr:hypothetical protein [Roseibium salinum]
MADHLKFLPGTTLKRLHDSAVRKKTVAAAAEAERIAGRIADTHGLFNPRDIESNPVLGPHQKVQLINALKKMLRKNKARTWRQSVGFCRRRRGDASSSEDRDLANRAFSHLTDGEADRDVIAREILRTKGVLPGGLCQIAQEGAGEQGSWGSWQGVSKSVRASSGQFKRRTVGKAGSGPAESQHQMAGSHGRLRVEPG